MKAIPKFFKISFLTLALIICMLPIVYAEVTPDVHPNDSSGIITYSHFIGRKINLTGELHSVYVYGQAASGYTCNTTVTVYNYNTGAYIAQSTSYLYIGPYSMWREYQFTDGINLDGDYLIGVQADGFTWIAYDNNAQAGDIGKYFTISSLTDVSHTNTAEWETIPAPADIPSIYVYYGSEAYPTPTPEITPTPGPDYIGGIINQLAPILPATIAIVVGTVLGAIFVGFLGGFIGFNICYLLCFLFGLIPLWGIVPMFLVDALLIYDKVGTKQQ